MLTHVNIKHVPLGIRRYEQCSVVQYFMGFKRQHMCLYFIYTDEWKFMFIELSKGFAPLGTFQPHTILTLRLLMSYTYMEHLFLMFLDHTQRRITVGRTPLNEWSARRRDLYLTTHDNHNRQISMPPVRFTPTISAGERSAAAHLLRSWVRIPPRAWIFVSCECHVLSDSLCDELITRPEESYPLWCVVVCDLETSRICALYIWH